MPQVQQHLMQLVFPSELRYADDDDADGQTLLAAADASIKAGAASVQCNGSGSTQQQQHQLQQLRSWSTPAVLPTHVNGRSTSPRFEGATVIELPECFEPSPSGRSVSPLSPVIGSRSPSSDSCNGGSTNSSNSSSSKQRRQGILSSCLRACCAANTTVACSSDSSAAACAPAGVSTPLSSSGWRNASYASSPDVVLSGSRRPSSLGTGRLSSSAGGWLKSLVSQRGKPAQQGLFKGLRVRVGLATGHISRGQAVEATSAYSMARGGCCCGLTRLWPACRALLSAA
jgi:hypothetical protein